MKPVFLAIKGNKVWDRFNAPQEDQIWYYNAAVEAYQSAGFSGFLLDELRMLADQMNELPDSALDRMNQ